jgi:hypothetical protein
MSLLLSVHEIPAPLFDFEGDVTGIVDLVKRMSP